MHHYLKESHLLPTIIRLIIFHFTPAPMILILTAAAAAGHNHKHHHRIMMIPPLLMHYYLSESHIIITDIGKRYHHYFNARHNIQ